jgi:hypothetical protein
VLYQLSYVGEASTLAASDPGNFAPLTRDRSREAQSFDWASRRGERLSRLLVVLLADAIVAASFSQPSRHGVVVLARGQRQTIDQEALAGVAGMRRAAEAEQHPETLHMVLLFEDRHACCMSMRRSADGDSRVFSDSSDVCRRHPERVRPMHQASRQAEKRNESTLDNFRARSTREPNIAAKSSDGA